MPEPEFDPPVHPELLSFGIIGGRRTPRNEFVTQVLLALVRTVRDRCAQYPNEALHISIVSQIPGPFSKPDVEGIFPARYARKTSHLLVNASVPESLRLAGVRKLFVHALQETKAAATDYLQKRKINVDTTNVMSLIDDLVLEKAIS